MWRAALRPPCLPVGGKDSNCQKKQKTNKKKKNRECSSPPYAHVVSPPYFSIKPMWKSRILQTIWSIASSVGRKVVRM